MTTGPADRPSPAPLPALPSGPVGWPSAVGAGQQRVGQAGHPADAAPVDHHVGLRLAHSPRAWARTSRGPGPPSAGRRETVRSAASPRMTGIHWSLTTAPGRSSSASRTAVVPSRASPTTVMTPVASSAERRRPRISTWSSATRTRRRGPVPAGCFLVSARHGWKQGRLLRNRWRRPGNGPPGRARPRRTRPAGRNEMDDVGRVGGIGWGIGPQDHVAVQVRSVVGGPGEGHGPVGTRLNGQRDLSRGRGSGLAAQRRLRRLRAAGRGRVGRRPGVRRAQHGQVPGVDHPFAVGAEGGPVGGDLTGAPRPHDGPVREAGPGP